MKSTKVQTLGAIRRGRAKDACAHVHVKRTCNGKYTEKAKDGDPYIWAKERAVPNGNGHS